MCLTLMLAINGWVYETFGISKRFPIKLLQCLLNVLLLKLALSAKCFIYRVTNWPLFIFNHLHFNYALIFVFRVGSPCFWAGIHFDKFWACGGFFERLGNVYDCEA